MQQYEQRYKPWRYLQQAVEVDRINAAILGEELTEIYSTSTPKGWPKPKKVNNLYIGLIVILLQQPRFGIYTRALCMTPV